LITPQKAILELNGLGLSQSQIVEGVIKFGASTTQETISRVGSGAIRSPNYELGSAIVSLLDFVKNKNVS
jgi:hypothetical protein